MPRRAASRWPQAELTDHQKREAIRRRDIDGELCARSRPATKGAPQGVVAPPLPPRRNRLRLLRGGENFRLGEHRGGFLGDDRAFKKALVLRTHSRTALVKVKSRKSSSPISPSSTSSQASGSGSRMSITSKCPISEL